LEHQKRRCIRSLPWTQSLSYPILTYWDEHLLQQILFNGLTKFLSIRVSILIINPKYFNITSECLDNQQNCWTMALYSFNDHFDSRLCDLLAPIPSKWFSCSSSNTSFINHFPIFNLLCHQFAFLPKFYKSIIESWVSCEAQKIFFRSQQEYLIYLKMILAFDNSLSSIINYLWNNRINPRTF
jgi:hypothetical protein